MTDMRNTFLSSSRLQPSKFEWDPARRFTSYGFGLVGVSKQVASSDVPEKLPPSVIHGTNTMGPGARHMMQPATRSPCGSFMR
jgi:hypothetical protein